MDADVVVLGHAALGGSTLAAAARGGKADGAGTDRGIGLDAKDTVGRRDNVADGELVCLGLNLQRGDVVAFGVADVPAIELDAEVRFRGIAQGGQEADGIRDALVHVLARVNGRQDHRARDRLGELAHSLQAEIHVGDLALQRGLCKGRGGDRQAATAEQNSRKLRHRGMEL